MAKMNTERAKLVCYRCMSRLTTPGQICSRCGHDNRVRNSGAGYLPALVLQNQYFVGRPLGSGGFGVTYLGYDLNLDRKVAIKEYFPRSLVQREGNSINLRPFSENETEDFQRGRRRVLEEGRLIAGLGNVPNVVQVYNAFPDNGTAYIVMEYVPGTTLANLVRNKGRLSFEYAYQLLRPVMMALEQIHQRGIIHRDISPDNIMVNPETNQVVLLDFGAAHVFENVKSGHTTSLRPGFAPVEQYSTTSAQDGRTDEYALCATFYFALTGKKPAQSTELAYSGTPIQRPGELGSDITPAQEAILLKGMATRMGNRYRSMLELRRAFDAGEDPQLTPAEQPEAPRYHGDSSGRRGSQPVHEPPPDLYDPQDHTVRSSAHLPPPPAGKNKGKRKNKIIILAAVLSVVAVTAIAVGVITLFPGEDKKPAPQPAAVVQSDNGAAQSDFTPSGPAVAATPAPDVPTKAPAAVISAAPEPTPEPTEAPTAAPTIDFGSLRGAAAQPASSAGSVIMSDRISDAEAKNETGTVLGSAYLRKDIASITFTDQRPGPGDDSWDISAAGDESVLAWVSPKGQGMYDLYIYGENGVSANAASDGLFGYYSNATHIRFNGLFNTSGATSMQGMFAGCASLKELDLNGMDTGSVENMAFMFNGCSSLVSLDLSGFDTGKVTDMSAMFQNCKNLLSLNLSGLNTSGVTNMSYMFTMCGRLTSLDMRSFDTSGVSNMAYMFNGCEALTALNVRGFDTGRVTNMSHMFSRCSALSSIDLSGFNTGSVVDMSGMFQGCASLTSLDLNSFDTALVTDMSYMFNQCGSLKSLNLKSFDTGRVTSMKVMFNQCGKLETLDLSGFNTSRVIDMSTMFQLCTGLKYLDLNGFDTSNVTDMSYMFSNCLNLQKLEMQNCNTANVQDMGFMFADCEKLSLLRVGPCFFIPERADMNPVFKGCSGTVQFADAMGDKYSMGSFENDFKGSATLQTGDTGAAVERLQRMLIAEGLLNGSADGDYGSRTANAVKSFQKTNGIPQDGIADARTQAKLFT